MPDLRVAIQHACQQQITELPRRSRRELHFVIADNDDLQRVCQLLSIAEGYLCTIVSTDERFLEDNTFKLYYVISMPEDRLIILEQPLRNLEAFESISDSFPAAEPLEQEIADLFGIIPSHTKLIAHSLLHECYPDQLYPLRPGLSIQSIKDMIAKHEQEATVVTTLPALAELPGMTTQVVGPIHAGIIEAGQFIFGDAGELIEQLTIRSGYKHRGIEKLFESNYTLENGWILAGHVCGDSSFAHGLAYCQAVEALADIRPPLAALYWRNLFLELERLYNHINDVSVLAHDIALDILASEFQVLREHALRLNQSICGHRLLRGINRPGGIVLPAKPDSAAIWQTVEKIMARFAELSAAMLKMQTCRARFINIGILDAQEAQTYGASGLMARAAGLTAHDFRVRHPDAAYQAQADMREILLRTVISEDIQASATGRQLPLFQRDLRGDVFARLSLRMSELESSALLIRALLTYLEHSDQPDYLILAGDEIRQRLQRTPNSEFGLGYVEGWRGDICYWVMKGAGNTIRRCKVRDPSVFNWHAFRLAVMPKVDAFEQLIPEKSNILADFPLINRSFNLSFAGNDG